MGKIDVPDAIKAVSAFMGSARQARNEERDRQAYRQQWEQTHALNLAADRRAQERLAMERQMNELRYTGELFDLASAMEDRADRKRILEKATATLGEHPEYLELIMAHRKDQAALRGQEIANSRNAFGFERDKIMAAQMDEERRLFRDAFVDGLGMTPEQAEAELRKIDVLDARRQEERGGFEHDQWKRGQAAAILEETFPRRTTPVGAQGYAAKSDLVNARQQYESSKREEMVPGEIKTRYGDSPEQIAAERSLGLGQETGRSDYTKEVNDILKMLQDRFYEKNDTSPEGGKWVNPAAEQLFNQASAALLASGEAKLGGMGFGLPPVGAPTPSDTTKEKKPQTPPKRRAFEVVPKTESKSRESEGSKRYANEDSSTWYKPFMQESTGGLLGGIPGDEYLGTLYGMKYPGSVKAQARAVQRLKTLLANPEQALGLSPSGGIWGDYNAAWRASQGNGR